MNANFKNSRIVSVILLGLLHHRCCGESLAANKNTMAVSQTHRKGASNAKWA
jgi:hypothetical protein